LVSILFGIVAGLAQGKGVGKECFYFAYPGVSFSELWSRLKEAKALFIMNRENVFLAGALLLFISFLVIWVRNFELAIIKGGYYYRWAENNRLRKVEIAAPRGRILNRDGEVLVDNVAVYLDKGGIKLAREEGLRQKAEGKEVVNVLQRRYWPKEAAAHLTGYLGAVEEGELGKERCSQKQIDYQLNDLMGRGGLEQEYDCLLLGRSGERLVEVNSQGEIIRGVGRREAKPGEDLIITIDFDLQKLVYKKMEEKKGAVVVLAPRDNSVLAMVSSPSFDPNAFTWQRDEDKIRGYLEDVEEMPFLNRAISGTYHPGSVFKPIVAIGALEEGKINGQTTVEDVGVIKIGKWEYRNWYWTDYGQKEGRVDLVKGIKRSNDIYFYKIGEWLGARQLAGWAKKFGLGELTGIDLPGERKGLIPSPEWKQEVKGEPWFLGNTYHFAIGQGDLTTTPLQMAVVTAAIANGGKLCQPHLKLERSQRDCQDLEISKENLQLIRRGMMEACSPKGTGFPFFNFKPQVGCKTGTAEVGDGTGDSHAWFTLFAPVDNPEVVITVFVERGGSGAHVAAPIAKEIMEYLVKRGYF